MGSRHRLLAFSAVLAAGLANGVAHASTLPPSFQETTVFSGLSSPTAMRFSPDGRVFVAEKSGLIKVYASLTSTTPTVFADLRTQVDDYWDRGLLGLALDPGFPAQPYVYALYTHDAPIGGTAPVWGDACPTPPGPTTNGCVVSGRLVRLTATGDTATAQTVLVEDWCQQFPSHSVGDLRFGADGALYVSAGEGADFNAVDYGNNGTPRACGDPGTLTAGGAEGGALRSQSLRRAAGDAVSLDGAVLRLDPATGAAAPGNPLGSSLDPNARRITAEGLRNPFRFAIRPGTNELWVGDVGWNTWEEIDRIVNPAGATISNFGWPCYEGTAAQSGYQSANIGICQGLYSQAGAVTPPYYTYNHGSKVVGGESCPTGTSSISGLAFYPGGSYPAAYNGALFFADYSRLCIWAMQAGANGLPDPTKIVTFVAGAAGPVSLETGPNGDLFYVDLDTGTIRRIQYLGGNRAPVASASASPTSGTAPLTVSFDGSASSDPDGDALTYAWDLNGDGVFGDATAAKPTTTYAKPGTYSARLKVTDSHGASTISDPITISASNTPPAPVIYTPLSTLTWRVGDLISFSGSASDTQDGALPASALQWTLIVHHCPAGCHTHVVQTFPGVASGSFNAPDHEYPSYLELQLTATDANGAVATTSVSLQPVTVALSFASAPAGLQLTVGGATSTTPFSRTVIVGSQSSVAAPTPQSLDGTYYDFSSWSDGGAASHTVVAGSSPSTYTATYTASSNQSDTIPPAVSITAPIANSTVGATVSVTASASDNVGVAGVQFRLDGAPLGSEDTTAPYSVTWDTTAASNGPHTLTAVARDAAANTATASAVDVTVANAPPGLVAAYAFDDGAGTTVRDSSGNANNGTAANATWSTAGKTGGALSFNGASSLVTVPDSASLDLTTGMTLEAWVDPNSTGTTWRTVLFKEQAGGVVYSLYANQQTNRPVGQVNIGGEQNAVGTAAVAVNTWTHLAVTYDGAALRLYVNGTLVTTTATGGPIPTSTGALRIGGNTIWPEWYAGLLDDVRVYNRALTTAQIQADMTGTVAPPASDTTPPAVSITAPAANATVAATTRVTANASDNVGVVGVQFRLDGAPLGGEDTTAPYSVTWDTTAASNGPHTLTAVARDAAANTTVSAPVAVTVSNAAPAAGVVAAYAFSDGAGTTVRDSSGNANNGTAANATWSTAGKTGGALSFNGASSLVTVPDSASLDLTTGMTLEAWVRPTATGTAWRTVLFKEQAGGVVYSLYANQQTNRPVGQVNIGGEQNAVGTAAVPLNAWTHLAVTYDGASLRLYVNGTLVTTTATGGPIPTSTGALRIGGNTIWPEWYAGLLDDVRVYNRALTAAQIQADMATPVG